MYKSIKVEPELTINDGFSTTGTTAEEEFQHEIFVDNKFNGRKNYHCSIVNDSNKFNLTNSSVVPKLKIRTSSKNDNGNNNTIIKNNDVTHVVLDEEYKCDLCLITFASGKLLKNHIIDHHQIDINNVLNNNNYNNNNDNNNNNNYNYSNNNYNNKVKAKSEQGFQQALESTYSSTRALSPSIEQYGISMEITSTYNQKIHKVDINRIVSQNTRIIQKDSIERFVCTLCGYNYLSQQLLTQHIYNSHVFGKIDCVYCSNNFTSTTTLRAHLAVYCKHIKEKEYNQKPFKCDLCDKSFSRPTKLKEHRTLHTGEKLHKCQLCFEEFQLYSHLVSHRYRVHMKKLPHPCQFCSKSFTRPSLLKFHINKAHIVTEPITYNCDICTKTFFTLYSLKTHKKVHLSKPHICKTCGKAFNRAITLKEHETLHTGEKPFKCQFCDRSFQRYSMLFDHRNVVHYKKKPITCSVCDKPFKKPHQLRDHMRVHLPSSVSVVKSVPNKR